MTRTSAGASPSNTVLHPLTPSCAPADARRSAECKCTESAMAKLLHVRTMLIDSVLCLVFACGLLAWTADVAFFEEERATVAPDVTVASDDLAVAPVGDPDYIREIEKRLLDSTGSDHDDPGILAYHGTIESVPAVLAALKRNPAGQSGGGTCCRSACLMALRQLSGSYHGTTDREWGQWWRSYRRTHPARPNARTL